MGADFSRYFERVAGDVVRGRRCTASTKFGGTFFVRSGWTRISTRKSGAYLDLGVEEIKERVRDVRMGAAVAARLQDLRYRLTAAQNAGIGRPSIGSPVDCNWTMLDTVIVR